MNWLDFVILCIMISSVAIGLKRGFGRSGLDFIAVVLAINLASCLCHPIAKAWHFSADPYCNVGDVYMTLFILIGAILIFCGVLIFGSTDFFDSGFSGLCGALTGVIIAHAVVATISMSSDPKVVPDALMSSTLGREFLTFDLIHRIVDFLRHFSGSS